MGPWLRSGRRRDICVLLAAAGELRGQALKARLEEHYDTHLDPASFYGSLEALVDSGHVEERTDGIHEVYALTSAGERAMLEHLRWLTDRIEEGGSALDAAEE